MIRPVVILILNIFILQLSLAHAFDNETLWNMAANSYDNGDYTSAVENYEKLIERDYISPELYYNLGNSYFKSGHLGASIWAYRRCLKLDPGMPQAISNLDYVRTLNVDKIKLERGGFILDIWNFLTNLFSYNGFLIIFSCAWWVAGATAAFLIIRGNVTVWPYYLLIAGVIVAIFCGMAAARRIKLDRFTAWGVMVAAAADIREGPGDDFERIEVGHEGLEFKILGAREDNYLIELGNGLKGWVEKDAVFEI